MGHFRTCNAQRKKKHCIILSANLPNCQCCCERRYSSELIWPACFYSILYSIHIYTHTTVVCSLISLEVYLYLYQRKHFKMPLREQTPPTSCDLLAETCQVQKCHQGKIKYFVCCCFFQGIGMSPSETLNNLPVKRSMGAQSVSVVLFKILHSE